MKKTILLIFILACVSFFTIGNAQTPPDSLSSNFSLAEQGCVQQHINIIYTGNAPATATYVWNFGGAVILSGSGQGPYWVKWETVGMKTVTLHLVYNGDSSFTSKQIHIMPAPLIFNMTGGGSYPSGGTGVSVGLSGSENAMPYKLRKNGVYTDKVVYGTGNAISFGLITEPGTYTAVADGQGCDMEMEGTAVVTVINPPPPPVICMVTFDTITMHNKIIWNKLASAPYQKVNVFRETFQNNVFEKIGETGWDHPGYFIDTVTNPLVKSDKYKISVVDGNGNESEKSPYHKTIHLNIDPGIYGYNLIWNYYEGFDFLTYHIWRKYSNGPYELVAGVASNVNSYTDFYQASGLTTYYIEIVRPEPCHPELKSTDISSTISNIATAAPLGVDPKDNSGIMIYPNPVRDKLFVVIPDPGQRMLVEVYMTTGQLVFSGIPQDSKTEIDLSKYSQGVYFVKISGNNSVIVRKIVKE